MKYKKPAFAMVALSLVAGILASLCLMTYPVAQESVHIEGGDDNFEIENNEQDNTDEIVPAFEHTNRGLTVTTTDSKPTDGRYSNFRLMSGNKYVDFTGDALAEYSPYVYYKVMNGDEDPDTPEITSIGTSKIIVNFVTEHTEDTHKEEVHIFDAITLKEHEMVDVGARIADEMVIEETKNYYILEFLRGKVALKKDDVEKWDIDLSGELILDSNYRYYLTWVGIEDMDFVCDMLWREADGDPFARVKIKYYYSGTKYIVSSIHFSYAKDPNTKISRCDDINTLNFETYYPQNIVN